jgi:serine/threonine protein kinase
MPLSVGDRLGPYEILAPIGAGGMGEVYRAGDTKLDRDVAIKVLPASFAQDPERLARFEREAKVLASLNHPNIAQIYGIEDRALVMELVPGESLKGPLSLETALSYARQIADALEAAHEKNIIHRDLKPANIMITPAGVVKVLDFGLAAVSQPSDSSDPVNSPTLTISPTRAGMILGTAAYMSPEQARGKAVDKRADIWAFGVVLFEMLTGKPLFEGETVSDTLAQVLTKEPDFNRVPFKVRRLLRSCLEKDPKRRLQAIGDMPLLLDAPESEPSKRSSRWWKIAAVAALAVAALGGWEMARFRQPPADQRVLRFQIEPPGGGAFSFGANNIGIALSPDGRTAAYIASSSGTTRLWVRPLDDTAARVVSGTEGAGFPFWSPDSKSIAFVSENKLERVDLAGGAPLTICEAPIIRGGSWNSDGQIIFGTLTSGLFEVLASGGTPSPLKIPGAAGVNAAALWPQMLPGGRFLYFAFSDKPEITGIYAASLAKPSEAVKLLSTDGNAVYAPAGNGRGYLLWLRGSTLVAQELDVAKLRMVGTPHPVADPVSKVVAGLMNASVSANGLLLYSSANPLIQFTWVDRTGKRLAGVGEPLDIGPYRLSPDGRRLATTRNSGIGTDLWLMELERGVASRFTFESNSLWPVWSPDGRTILYAHFNPPGLVRKASSGAGGEGPTFTQPLGQVITPTDWSRDGHFLVYSYAGAQPGLWVLSLTPDGRPAANEKPRRYTGGQFSASQGRFSPDTHWVAYQSDESGRSEIYADSFPDPRGKVQISTDGGSYPEWGPDGRELFYVSPDKKLMAANVKVGADSVEPSAPRELFPLPIVEVNPYDVAPDGQRFLIPGTPQQAAQPLMVIVNWPALLNKGAAAP